MASTGKIDKNFQFVIEGKRGSSYRGDISIDDISFVGDCVVDSTATLDPNPVSPSPAPGCASGEFSCNSKDHQCIPLDQICNFRNDCRNGYDESFCPSTCDFESGTMCKWFNSYWSDLILDWKLHLASSPSVNGTGPPADNTGKSSGKNPCFCRRVQQCRSVI